MTVRLKSYTGETGCVYQYYFVGKRTALPDDLFAPATEFIFDILSGRKPTFAVSIFLRESVVRDWQAGHGRELSDTEIYASAKMRLFQAFDEIEDLMEEGRRLVIDGEALEELLGKVGVE